MPEAYEEILLGESILRTPPDARHEVICERLHARVAASVVSRSCRRRDCC